MSQPGTTAGDLVHDVVAESLPIGDPAVSTYYLRLKRDGGLLTWSRSTDGVTWDDLFSKDFGTGLNGLDQRVTIVGHSWFNPGGSYADWDYITVAPLDQSPPSISIAHPANGASYLLGSPIVADYSCNDDVAVVSCAGTVPDGTAIDTAAVGPKTFTVTAENTAGNQSSLTHQYSVVHSFTGFFPPLDNPPTLNRVKAGAAVPVKFSLGGYHGLEIFSPGSPRSQSVVCNSGAPLDDVEETVTAGSSSLSYDPVLDRYVYVWKTNESWAGTCRRLEVTLNDGTSHVADLLFK